MESSIATEQALRIALWVGAIGLLLTLLAISAVLLLRWQTLRQQRRRTAFRQRWQPVLAMTTMVPVAAMPVLKRSEVEFLLLEWLEWRRTVRGDAADRLAKLLDQLALDGYLLAWLNRDRRHQVLALLVLGLYRLVSAMASVQALAMASDPLLSTLAARAWWQGEGSRIAFPLAALMARRLDWPLARTMQLAQEGGEPLRAALLHVLPDAGSAERLRILRLLEPHRQGLFLPHIAQWLAVSQPIEVRTQVLRLLERPADLPWLRQALQDADWQLRVVALQQLERLGTAEDIPALIAALHDPVWWVRYRAAQALLRAPSFGVAACAALTATLDDRYGRDMLRQVLADREAGL